MECHTIEDFPDVKIEHVSEISEVLDIENACQTIGSGTGTLFEPQTPDTTFTTDKNSFDLSTEFLSNTIPYQNETTQFRNPKKRNSFETVNYYPYDTHRMRKSYCKYNQIDNAVYYPQFPGTNTEHNEIQIPIDILPNKKFFRGHKFFKHHKKKSRTLINLRTKLDIIKFAEVNPRMRQAAIADYYGIDRTAVNKILKRKSEFLDFYNQNCGSNPVNVMPTNKIPCRWRKVESALNNWYCETVHQNDAVQISDQLVKERAMEFAQIFGAVNFRASDIWLQKFYRRFQLFRTSDVVGQKESMAGYEGMNYDDDEWRPPTAAEEKIIQARRERANKVSELMGQKMLLGWKMLATSCGVCNTVLLQDREGTQLCVSCNELDSDNQKDDPAVNVTAAECQMREHSESETETSPNTTLPPTHFVPNTGNTLQNSEDITNPNICGDSAGITPQNTIDTGDTLDVLVYKIKWATDALRASQNVDTNTRLCNLIKSAADAIVAVKNINL